MCSSFCLLPTLPADRRRPAAYRLVSISLIILGLALSLPAWAAAQTPVPDELVLYVRRTFGYGGGSQIQGSFRFEIQGPADLTQVTYRIDDTVISTTTQSPFRVDFQTDDYPLGQHTLTAEGLTAGGRTLTAAPRRYEFVSAGAGTQAAIQLIVPLLGGVLGVMALTFVISMLPTWLGRRQPLPAGAPRDYGLLGGAICPRCGRPFPRHLWGINVSFAGKFDRCDHCGKWSLVRRASPEALQAAEAAELAANPRQAPPADASLRKEIDDSRYVD